MEMLIPDETFGELYRREFVAPLRTGVPYIDQSVGLRSGHLVEITGPHQSGKTKLLIQITTRCILPKAYGGLESIAILIDLDHKMDIQLLISHLEKHIQDASVLEDSLQRFQQITCDSSFEFLATLKVLNRIITNREDLATPLGCILVDNLNAFLYIDKATSLLHDVPMTMQKIQESAFHSLRELLSFCVPIIVTKNSTVQWKAQDRGKPELWTHHETIQSYLQKAYSQRFLLVPLEQVPDSIKIKWRLVTGGPNRGKIVIKSTLPDGPPMILEFEA
eukprot:g8831.t1